MVIFPHFCWAGWAKARRGCFSGGNLGVCSIGLLGLEVWDLFHLSPVSNFMLTLSYVVVALFVVLLIFGVSSIFVEYRRLKSGGGSGGKYVASDELENVVEHWVVCIAFTMLVALLGALTGSLLLVLPLLPTLFIFYPLRVWVKIKGLQSGVITVKAAYLVNIALIACLAVPVGVDAYVFVSTF